MRSARPIFVGPEWLLPGQGFAYEGEAPADLAQRTVDPDEWIRLLAIFERLRNGSLDQDVALQELIAASEDPEIRVAGLKILGHAGARDTRAALAQFFRHGDVDSRLAAYEAAMFSCDLRLVDGLLDAYRVSAGHEKLAVMSAISHLLESEPGTLYDDTDELPPDQYVAIAIGRARTLQHDYGTETAIFENLVLSLPYIMQRIEELCDAVDAVEYSGWISKYVDLFEAMTGCPPVRVFEEDVTINPYYAREMIATFQRSSDATRFEPGYRFFFGHRLPS